MYWRGGKGKLVVSKPSTATGRPIRRQCRGLVVSSMIVSHRGNQVEEYSCTISVRPLLAIVDSQLAQPCRGNSGGLSPSHNENY